MIWLPALRYRARKPAAHGRIGAARQTVPTSTDKIYSFFEGTSEIQRLVIST
jgi:hypothetical protein